MTTECVMKFSLILIALVLSVGVSFGADEALAEVNAARARVGLPAFTEDPSLTAAAKAAADYRATYLMFGHTSNDFGFLPSGASADAAGCAAYHASYGWMSCCVDDRVATHAGAAFALGRDGKRYMHLFVRRGGGQVIQQTTQTVQTTTVTKPALSAPGVHATYSSFQQYQQWSSCPTCRRGRR